jgi:hypothetical protein
VARSPGLLAFTPILAHFGHWYISVPTFMAPVAIVAIAVKVSERRALRRAREGDTSHLRVIVRETEEGSVLAVKGALDYLALLDLEQELGEAVRRDPRVLIDLREIGSIEEESAWSVTEVIRSVQGAQITVLVGSAPESEELRRICSMEGVTIVEDWASVTGGAPSAGGHGAPSTQGHGRVS